MPDVRNSDTPIVYLGLDLLDKPTAVYDCERLGHAKEHLVLSQGTLKVDRYGCNTCKYCYDFTIYPPEPTEPRRRRSKKVTQPESHQEPKDAS